MKLIYLADQQLDQEHSGVAKKIWMQVQAFEKAGAQVIVHSVFSSNILVRAMNKVPLVPTYPFILTRTKEFSQQVRDADGMYIRKLPINIFFVLMLRYFKCINDGLKIVMEVPTFPYDNEMRSTFLDRVSLIRDRLSRRYLRHYLDRIVTFSEDEEVFGVKTIAISNGIDVQTVTKKKNTNQANDELNLVGVAALAYWHGYDRLILGLERYYKENPNTGKQVRFHIVGTGPELSKLKAMTQKLNLSDYVIFYGALYGESLDRVYDGCQLAVSGLGIHRRYKDQKSSSLKSREYCAKGIPFVKAEVDDAFDLTPFDYCLNVPMDESPIDIFDILAFYDGLQAKYAQDEITECMRSFADKNLSWCVQLEPVIQFYENEDIVHPS